MGSTGTPFARNVEFEATFPELGRDELTRNRHGERLGLLTPDPAGDQPQALHARPGRTRHLPRRPRPARHSAGRALRLQEGAVLQRARGVLDPVHDPRLVLPSGGGRTTRRSMMRAWDAAPAAAGQLGCRPDDRIDRAFVAEDGPPATFTAGGQDPPRARVQDVQQQRDRVVGRLADLRLRRHVSPPRQARAATIRAKLLMVPAGPRAGAGERLGYLPRARGVGPDQSRSGPARRRPRSPTTGRSG